MNPQIFQGIAKVLETEKSKGCRLLDASPGEGESSQCYRELGFEVVASDYDPSVFRVQGIQCIQADLNQTWPFGFQEFDVVVLQEVVEHLENVPHAFREAQRILRPGGCLVMSTPNMLNWTSRLRFLFTGYYHGRKKPLRVTSSLGDGPNWNILPFHLYHWVAHNTQFEMEEVVGVRWRWHSILLGVACYPIAACYTYGWWVLSEKNDLQRRFNREVWRKVFSGALMFGQNMVMKFRKKPVAGSTPPHKG